MNHKEVGRTRIKRGKSKLAVLVGALALTLEVTALSGATITAQPQSQTVVVGTNFTLTVTATGTDPLGYQWRKGGADLTDGGNVSGAATAALALANVRLTDAGNYDAVVTDASSSVTSQVAVLTVSLPPGTELGREWARIWGSASDDTGWSVAADKAGNAYVVGDTAGALDGQTNLGGLDVFLTKYSASGVKVWTRQWGSTADDNNAQVVVDNAGNIYVTGSTRGAMDGQPTYGDWDAFLSKFSPDGARLWTRVWGSGQHEHPLAITVDCSNRVCIVGYTGGTFDGQPKAGPGTDDSFLTVFSEDGNRLWSRIWGSNADDLAGGVASDAAGNLYVGGSSRGPIDGQPHQGNFDYYLSKFSPDGTRLWTRMGGSSAQDFGYKVALDPAGMIYLSGYTQGAFDGQTNVGGFDCFLVQYLPDGTQGWTRLWGSPVNDIPYDLGVDNTGSILVSGYTEGAFDGQGNQGATDLFLTRFFPDGTRNRTCLWGSATNDVGGGIALVNGGALFVAGCTAGAFDGQTNAGGQDMFLTRWVPQATARIVSQPTNQTIIAGATASFQVMASGSAPLSYQWFFNQTNLLAGATNAALTLTNAQSANAGSYNVVLSYSCSSVTSQVAILTVLEPAASVHYVDGGNANPVSPFGSWATAARTIQDAVAVAVDGDTVLVTNGVYLLDKQITITNGITVTSVNGPRVSVVDGGYPARTGRCFVLSHSNAVLEGFTIRGGYSQLGGGVRLTSSDLANDRTLVWASPGSDQVAPPVLDPDGNLYIASGAYSSDSNRIFVEKYAPGGTRLWTRELRSDAEPSCSHLDGLGHLYVGGCVGPSGSLGNLRDAYLVKLDLQGNVLWERTWGSTLHDFVFGLQTDAAGNVYASGYTWGDIDGAAKPGYDDLFLSKFTPDGDRPWTHLYGTFADEALGLLLPDGQGGFYMVGFGNEAGAQLHLPSDFRFARLTADGTEVWTQLVGIPGRNEWVSFAGTDSGGSVYAGGVTDGATNAVTGSLESGVYLAKLQPDGSTAWARCWDLPSATATGVQGAVDQAGNVYLAAPGEMTADGIIHARSDIYLWKISSAGDWLWCKPFGIGTNGCLAGLTLDGAGGLYLDWYGLGGFEGHVNAGLYDSHLAHWTFDNPFGGLMSRCIVEDNQAEQGGGVALGQLGGLRNCLVVGNAASGLGGGIYSEGGTVESSTISSNSALCGAGLYIDGPVQVANSILYGNTAGAWADCASGDATALVSYSLVGAGSVPSSGNITGDPLFVNPAGNDYRLAPGSPCVDTGTNLAWMARATDLDGKLRVVGLAVDMGTYELIGSCVSPPGGLVAWWPGEGSFLDHAGTNNGTGMDGVGFAPGIVGQAFDFDGVSNYVQVATADCLNPVAGQGWTIEGWIRPITNADMVIVSKGNEMGTTDPFDYGRQYWDFTLWGSSTGMSVNFEVGHTGDNVDTVSSISGIGPGVWSHVAVVVASMGGAGSDYSFYINGNNAGCYVLHDGTVASITTTEPLRIGAGKGYDDNLHNFFNGQIDELAIYNRALSASEIAAIYVAASAGKCYTFVNQAPSFVKGADITVNEDAGAQIVANWATTISPGPANEAGQNVTFIVVSNDNTGLFSNQPALGANGTLTFTSAANRSGVANVTVVLKDDGGTANGGQDTSTPQSFKITVAVVNEAPIITVQPRSQTVLAGSDVTFGVKATGTPPLSYQWRLNGTNLFGATNLSLFLPAVTAADAGNYTVVVTNVAGSTNSLPAVLTVLVLPTITVQPSDRTVKKGEGVEFDVTAVGSQPLSYQWFFNQTIPLAGATNNSLILTNVQMSQAGSYRVTVTNVAGSVASTPARLTVVPVNSAPVLAAISNQTVDEGTLLTFKVTASDADIPAQTLTYTLEPGSPIGATINGSSGVFSWTPTEAQGPSTNVVTVKVTDDGVPPLSDTKSFQIVVREVNQPPVLAAIGNTNVDEATLLTFTVTASDADIPAQTLTYTLEPGSPVGAVINAINGVFTWTPTYAESASTNLITVKVTDNGMPPLSDSKSFTVTVRRVSVPPMILTPPQSQMALAGADVTFSVVAGGTAPLSYQWRFNGIPLNGATNSNLYLSAVQTNQAGYYSVVVTNLAGSATSAAALLTLKLPATLTGTVSDALNGQPLAGVAVSAGGRTNFTDLQGRYVLTNLAEGVLKADFDADVTSGTVPLTVHFPNLSTTDALTVRGEKTGYATYQNRQVRVSAGKTNELNFSLSPALSRGMRVVLNWGPMPKDLDLHMQIEGTTHEVSYNDRDTPYGRLDHDVTDGWGPETLTVDQFYPGLYHYYVEHYDVFMPGARLTNSAAQAHIYRGTEELKVVSVPTEGSGAYWHVCVVDGETGAIRLVNQITDSEALPTGGTVGGGGGGLAGLAFAWDFGDGSTSTNESPVKVYGRPGSYTVGLRVEGEQGQSDGKVRADFVVVGVGNASWLSLEWVGGRAVLSLSGVVGKTYRIESTSRLGPAAVWQTVATLTLSSPVQTWRDDQSGNLTTRFYRAVSP